MAFTRADGSTRVELPARTVLVAAGTAPNITYEKEHPGTLRARQQAAASSRAYRAVQAAPDGTLPARARSRTASSPRTTPDGKFVTYYGDNHPRYNGNVVKAMASAKHGYPHVVALFADEIAALDPAAAAGARAAPGRRWSRGSTISCWRGSSASSA